MTLREWFGLCKHEWEMIEKLSIIGAESNMIKGFIYVSKCKKCGKIKQFRTYAN